jgi:hypothetical protein
MKRTSAVLIIIHAESPGFTTGAAVAVEVATATSSANAERLARVAINVAEISESLEMSLKVYLPFKAQRHPLGVMVQVITVQENTPEPYPFFFESD